MKVYEIDGKVYRLPNELTDFQLQMYIHLINWKWAHLTQESGYFKHSPCEVLSQQMVSTPITEIDGDLI